MNGSVAFDTLAVSKKLVKEGGFTQTQAEAIAEALAERDSAKVDKDELAQLATKADILRVEKQISDLETRVMRSTYNAMFGLVAAIAAISAVVIAILK